MHEYKKSKNLAACPSMCGWITRMLDARRFISNKYTVQIFGEFFFFFFWGGGGPNICQIKSGVFWGSKIKKKKFCLGGEGIFWIYFLGPNIHEAKSGVSSFSGGSPKIKVAQTVLRHALVLEFLSSDDFLRVGGGRGSESKSYRQTLEWYVKMLLSSEASKNIQ